MAWAIVCSAFFFFVYGGTNWVASTRVGLPAIHFQWERYIPFVPAMIVPYLSIDLLFAASFFVCRDRSHLHRHVRRVLFVIAFAGVCFLLFPLQMNVERPVVEGMWGPWFRRLHALDQPHNLVPSLHCALAAVLLAVYAPRARSWRRALVRGWFVLIGASTLLTLQHHAIDAVTGLALGLLALWIFPGRFDPTARAARPGLAGRYGLGAAALALVGLALGPWGWLLLWPAVSCGIVGLGYAGVGAAVFRKRDGRLPVATWLLLLPYLAAARIVHRWYARKLAPLAPISPELLIGMHRARAADVPLGAIVDLAAEGNAPQAFRRLPYLSLPVLDLTPPTVDQLESAVQFIRHHARPGRPVFVCCALGVSRSACVAAAWLLERGLAGSAEEAVAHVRARRPGIVMSEPMLAHLRQFAARRVCRSARGHPRMAAGPAGW